MKRLLPWLLALCCGASSAQVLQVYCNAANQTPCNTTTPYLGNSGDAWWLAFGKTNANANYLCGALGICLGNSGLVIGNPSGGAKGAGSINMQSCFVNGVACNSGGTPGGSAFELQYNNSGTFGGIALGTSGQPLLSSGSSGAPAFGLMGLTALQTQSADTLVCNPTGSTASLEACTLAARLNFSGTALDLSPSGVTAGSYTCTNETVDTYGRVTSAANGSCGGSSITLQTNGTNNASQTTLNLVGTGNVAVTNPTGGTVDIGPISEPVNAQTGPTYTIQSTDCGKQVTFTNASAVAVTVPQATGSFASCQFDVTDIGAGTATLTPTTSTINGASSLAVAQNRQCTINSDGTNWQVIGCTALVSGGGGGITLENAGSSLGTITTLNCSTGTTCTASSGTGTITASASSSPASLGWAQGSIAQAQSFQIAPGSGYTVGSAGVAVITTCNCTIQNLYIHTVGSPASGQTFTFTLYYGAIGSLAATALTCQIASGSNGCSDTTHQVSVTPGNAWSLQVATSSTSGSTGNIMIGLELN